MELKTLSNYSVFSEMNQKDETKLEKEFLYAYIGFTTLIVKIWSH